jgi:CHAT domain-containing protein/predicted negative regulator of RcsB-dependent stress response
MSVDIRGQIELLNRKVEHFLKETKIREALPLAEESLKMCESSIDESDVLYADSLHNMARIQYELSDFSAAEEYVNQALEIKRAIYGETDKSIASSLLVLGKTYQLMSRFSDAEKVMREAIRNCRETVSEEDELYIECISVTGGNHYYLSEFAKFQEAMEEVERLRKATVGENHLSYAKSLNNLGLAHYHNGDFKAALNNYQRALEIISNVSGKDNAEYAYCLTTTGNLLVFLGFYDNALDVLNEGLEIALEQLGENRALPILIWEKLGDIYFSKNISDEAEAHYVRARDAVDSVYGKENLQYGREIYCLGRVYLERKEYSEAERLLTEAAEIIRSSAGEKHINYSFPIRELVNLYFERRNFEKAEGLINDYIGIQAENLHEGHPSVARGRFILAKIFAVTGRFDECLKILNGSIKSYDSLIGHIFSTGSDKERLEYLREIKDFLEFYLSIVLEKYPDSDEIVRDSFEFLLKRKAIAAEAMAVQQMSVLGGKYPELRGMLDELSAIKSRIARKTFAGPGNEGCEGHEKILGEWNRERNKLEGELVRKIPEMNLEDKFGEVSVGRVAGVIPADSVLVEYVKFRKYNFDCFVAERDDEWGDANYIVYTLGSGESGLVNLVEIGNSNEVDQAVRNFRKTISGNGNQSDWKKYGVALRGKLIDPLELNSEDAPNLIIAPDGELNNLPFEILPGGDGKFLLDEFGISYLTAGRDLLTMSEAGQFTSTQPVIAADPDFDLGDETEDAKASTGAVESRISKDVFTLDLYFKRLPGTRMEAGRIGELLDVEPMYGPDILKEKIRGIKSPRILHLATHGFFLDDKSEQDAFDNPLLRSGLTLAGANTFLGGKSLPENAEDGILTAEDVSGLDLLGTEMVVLSACNTGLGVIHSGEGVLGMRRAFTLAGAKTLVMSLWNVPDLPTSILMERFYMNLFDEKMGRAESLRDAQIYLRNLMVRDIRDTWLSGEMIEFFAAGNEREKHRLKKLTRKSRVYRPFADPFYWGAFICQGNSGVMLPAS